MGYRSIRSNGAGKPQNNGRSGTPVEAEHITKLPRIAHTSVGTCFVSPGSELFAVTGITAANGKPVVIRVKERKAHGLECLAYRPKMDIGAGSEEELREKIHSLAVSVVENRDVYRRAEAIITVAEEDGEKRARFGILLRKRLGELGITNPEMQAAQIMRIVRDAGGDGERLGRDTVDGWLDGSVHCAQSRERFDALSSGLGIPELNAEFYDAWLTWSRYRAAGCAWIANLAREAQGRGEREIDVIEAVRKEKGARKPGRLADFADFKLDIVTNMQEGLREVTKELAAVHVSRIDNAKPKSDAQKGKKHVSVVSRGLVTGEAPESVEALSREEAFAHMEFLEFAALYAKGMPTESEAIGRLLKSYAKVGITREGDKARAVARITRERDSVRVELLPDEGKGSETVFVPSEGQKRRLDGLPRTTPKTVICAIMPRDGTRRPMLAMLHAIDSENWLSDNLDEGELTGLLTDELERELRMREAHIRDFGALVEDQLRFNRTLHKKPFDKKELAEALQTYIFSGLSEYWGSVEPEEGAKLMDKAYAARDQGKMFAFSWDSILRDHIEFTHYKNEFEFRSGGVEFKTRTARRVWKLKDMLKTVRQGDELGRSLALRDYMGPDEGVMTEKEIDGMLAFYGIGGVKQRIPPVCYLWSRAEDKEGK